MHTPTNHPRPHGRWRYRLAVLAILTTLTAVLNTPATTGTATAEGGATTVDQPTLNRASPAGLTEHERGPGLPDPDELVTVTQHPPQLWGWPQALIPALRSEQQAGRPGVVLGDDGRIATTYQLIDHATQPWVISPDHRPRPARVVDEITCGTTTYLVVQVDDTTGLTPAPDRLADLAPSPA